MNPVTMFGRLRRFQRDALAFFREHDLYRTGDATVDLGLRRVRVISSAPLAHQILIDDRFVRGQKPYGPLGTFAGQGSLRWLIGPTLPVIDGDAGRARRSIVRPTHVNISRSLKKVPLCEHVWTARAEGVHDLHMIASEAVFSYLCDVMFGRRYPEWHERIARTIDEATDALDRLSKSFRPYGCAYGSDARTLRTCRATLHTFAAQAIADLRAAGDDAFARAEAPPMMRHLLHHARDGALTEDDLVDEVVTHLIAGMETTTITCCWAITSLIQHPDELDALRACAGEARAQRLAWCVHETTRLYPAFWTMIRVADTEVNIETDASVHRFKRGDVLFVSPLLIHRNPAYWPDPDRFDPTRHDGRQRVATADFLPFGFGHRACLGAQLSSAIIARVLDGFVQATEHTTFTFRADEPDGPTPDPKIIVLKSHTGFSVSVEGSSSARAAREAHEATAPCRPPALPSRCPHAAHRQETAS